MPSMTGFIDTPLSCLYIPHLQRNRMMNVQIDKELCTENYCDITLRSNLTNYNSFENGVDNAYNASPK